jgi:hypothetical protein
MQQQGSPSISTTKKTIPGGDGNTWEYKIILPTVGKENVKNVPDLYIFR